nr:hypothetical protein [Tanacetum cinerariifolium]
MKEINNFQQEPDETFYQSCKRFKELLMKCPQYYLTKMQEVILFYNRLDIPTRQILDLKSVIPTKTAADVKVAIQEVAEYSQKWVYMLSLRERMELDLEARLMGETLVLNRSLDPLYGDYIKLNTLNVPLELRRDQVDNFMPIIEEDDIINEPMIDIMKTRNNESFNEYPSFCDFDRNIHIDSAYNLRFSCMIVENMDGYRDQDMGDVIFGEPFCKASCMEVLGFIDLMIQKNDTKRTTE